MNKKNIIITILSITIICLLIFIIAFLSNPNMFNKSLGTINKEASISSNLSLYVSEMNVDSIEVERLFIFNNENKVIDTIVKEEEHTKESMQKTLETLNSSVGIVSNIQSKNDTITYNNSMYNGKTLEEIHGMFKNLKNYLE